MDGDELVRELERRFLPALRVAADWLNAGFPDMRATAWSQGHGQATTSPGHIIGLTCSFPDAPTDQPDEVTLELCVSGIRGPGPLIAADVIWGHPGQIEANLFPGSVLMSEQTLRRIEAELPRLVEVLRTAVRRGRPQS